MLLEFDRYLNIQLCPGEYYVQAVNVDEKISEVGVMQLSVKFATAEGFIIKEYLLNEHGMRSFYEDFVTDFYWESLNPIDSENQELARNLDLLSSEFDTNIHLVNREFMITIKNIDGRNQVDEVAPCKIAHAMSQYYIKPFMDNLEHADWEFWNDYQNEQQNESFWKYMANKSCGLDSDFEFGGLRGEEAETLYWNID
jgi:hypothetical protein